MIKNTLKSIIRAGGATLNKNGAMVDFCTGYQVSRRDCYTLNAENVNEILTAVNGLLNEIDAGEFVGIWVDSGLVYIDISERIPRLSDALRLGIERKQKSIFDWCTRLCFSCEV